MKQEQLMNQKFSEADKATALKKDLEYYRINAEEDYVTTPISVLRYISELEAALNSSNAAKKRL